MVCSRENLRNVNDRDCRKIRLRCGRCKFNFSLHCHAMVIISSTISCETHVFFVLGERPQIFWACYSKEIIMPLATKYNGTYEQALGYNTLIIKLKNMHAFCQFGLFNVKPNHFIFLFRVFFKCKYLY